MEIGLIADTETTSTEEGAEVIELAFGRMSYDLRTEGEVASFRFKPNGKISCGAMATHHIIPEDLEDCGPSCEATLPPCDYIIGHNIDFDWRMLGSKPVKRICTLAMARWLWPNEDSHTLGACMYRIFPHAKAREIVKGAHSAGADVMMVHYLLNHWIATGEINAVTLPALHNVSEICRVPKVWSFGKHQGKTFAETDRGYLNWAAFKAPDMDPYVIKACKKALGLA